MKTKTRKCLCNAWPLNGSFPCFTAPEKQVFAKPSNFELSAAFRVIFGVLLFVCSTIICSAAENPIKGEKTAKKVKELPKWSVPTAGELRNDLVKWLETGAASPEIRERVLAAWPTEESTDLNLTASEPDSQSEEPKSSASPTSQEPIVSPEILFERTLGSMKIASPEVAGFIDTCNSLQWNELPFGKKLVLPPLPEPFRNPDPSVPPRLTGALKMCLIQRLIRCGYYDEALVLLREMNPENSIDPLAVLFCTAIACNELMLKDEGLDAVKQFNQLLESTPTYTPAYSRRFAEVIKLLRNELDAIEKDKEKPTNISRRMQDIQRRLGLGDTDKNVQEVERGVIESLDKLIEKLEQQQKKMRGSQGGQGNNPADFSQILKQKGPGNVTDKPIGSESGWGDLPPKEREEALMRIEKEFPSHYRDIIEQYFRQMSQ
ncbi:MAG: hypothetical protein ACRC2T_20705 [Thermoguttaceae bacterium]